MNEPLEQLLRATFREDATRMHNAGDLASSARARLGKQRRRRWQIVGSGLAVMAVAGGIGIASTVNDTDAVAHPPAASASPTTPEPTEPEPTGPEPDLVGTEWQLIQFARSGQTTTVPADIDSTLRFDGKGGFSAHACNYTGGSADLDGQRVDLDMGGRTLMLCSGLEGEVELAVFGTIGSGPLDWNIDRHRLVLQAGNGDTLVYRVRASIYPDPSARPLTAGERGRFQYRVAIADSDSGPRSAVMLDVRAGPGTGWGGGSMLATPIGSGAGAETLLFHELDDEYIVTGVAPAGTVRIVHHDPASGADTELARYPVDGEEWSVFAGFVPSHTNSSTITAYDAGGDVVATWSRDR
jgi:heat shock protein HslJ